MNQNKTYKAFIKEKVIDRYERRTITRVIDILGKGQMQYKMKEIYKLKENFF